MPPASHPEPRRALRALPAVHQVLAQSPLPELAARHGRSLATAAVQEVIARARARLLDGGEGGEPPRADALAAEAAELLARRLAPRLTRVINATGVVLHTNLGRAPLPAEAIAAAARVGAGYSNLELDLETGGRGDRHAHVEALLCELTGAEAAIAVNNNAAAVLLALAALARDGEVIVSRGQLVEIGGSFRIPDVMAQSGCRLVEVGTTNRTRIADYEGAITAQTTLLCRVHTSNYRIVGFTEEVPLAELVALGRRRGLPVLDDLGSGMLVDLRPFGLPGEPTVREAVAAGADAVSFSGDKLLGGPQAGLLVGRREVIERCRRHPLMRALRPDKLTLAALEATLALYRDPKGAIERIPALRMLSLPLEEVASRARRLAAELSGIPGLLVRLQEGGSAVGGGALPLTEPPTLLVACRPEAGSEHELAAALRAGDPPLLGRVAQGWLLLDPRTVDPVEEAPLLPGLLAAAIARFGSQAPPPGF